MFLARGLLTNHSSVAKTQTEFRIGIARFKTSRAPIFLKVQICVFEGQGCLYSKVQGAPGSLSGRPVHVFRPPENPYTWELYQELISKSKAHDSHKF